MGATEPERRVEQALIDLVRRTTDPRGNASLRARSGVDLERAVSVVLFRISELGPVRLSDVATAMGVDISTASRPVAKLVERGWVERRADPADARAFLLRCTPAGRKVVDRLRAARHEWLRDVLATFDAGEREQFAELFDRFVSAVIVESG